MKNWPSRVLPAFAIVMAIAGAAAYSATAATAHGFSSVAYAHISETSSGRMTTELQLEYDLLLVSAADAKHDDALYEAGTEAFDNGDADARLAALEAHTQTVNSYLDSAFTVTSGGTACTAQRTGALTETTNQGVLYVAINFEHSCPTASKGHVISSRLFPDSEGFVTGTKTILTYEIDDRSGSAALDAAQPSFSTEQSTAERFWEFFRLGAEHLLGGLDHILFLLALIAGSRRLREVVIAATTFTVAHSVTFVLASVGIISMSARIVEPIIALSISVVAAWYLWRLWRLGKAANDLDSSSGPLGLDRAGWLRLGVVFLFGLIHGLGFASALGISEAWSWTLLWSLLVFNLGIEAVQIAIIAALFPLLSLLRRRAPRLGLWATGALALGVTVTGLFWFAQRVLGL